MGFQFFRQSHRSDVCRHDLRLRTLPRLDYLVDRRAASTAAPSRVAGARRKRAIYFGACYALLNPITTLDGTVSRWPSAPFTWRWVRCSGARAGLTPAWATPVLLSIALALDLPHSRRAIQFSQYRITMAWAAEAAILTWIGRRFNQDRFCVAGLAICILVWFPLGRARCLDLHRRAPIWTAGQRAIPDLLDCGGRGVAMRALEPRKRPADWSKYLGGHVVLLCGLTLEVSVGPGECRDPAALSVSRRSLFTILYAVYALALVSIGVATRTVVNRLSGLVLLGLVVLKLYLYDVVAS